MNQEKPAAEINWQDFNYPPLLRLIHFVPSEIHTHRMTILLRFSIHLILLVEFVLNLINNCIQTAQGWPGIRILYSFLFLLFVCVDLFSFYRAYAGILKEKSMLGMYIYLEPILWACWIAFSIANFLGFNGFVQVVQLFQLGEKGPGVLGIIQSLLFITCAGISGMCYYTICSIRKSLSNNLMGNSSMT